MVVNVDATGSAIWWLAYGTHQFGSGKEHKQQRIDNDLSREREVEPGDGEQLHSALAARSVDEAGAGNERGELSGLGGGGGAGVVVRESAQSRESVGPGGVAGASESRGDGGGLAQHVADLRDRGRGVERGQGLRRFEESGVLPPTVRSRKGLLVEILCRKGRSSG